MEDISYQETHDVQASHWWYQARLEIIRRMFEAKFKRKDQGRILEIGAGSGVNIRRLREFGSVEAVEMHDGGRSMIAAAFPDVDVRNGALPEAELFQGKTYDAICMFDVLEHVEPHIDALKVVREHTHDDGHLFLTVPAYQWLWSQHDVAMHHYRRYSRETLREALEASGWTVETIGYFNTWLFPLALVARLKDRIFRPKISSGLSVPPSGINSLFFRVFASEAARVVRGGFPFGLSLFVVAKPAASQK